MALSASLLFHPESIMAHFPLTACSFYCSCCCASAQHSSDVLDNLFLCQYPSEGGVCIIPMAFDGSRLYLSYQTHVTQILSLVTPAFLHTAVKLFSPVLYNYLSCHLLFLLRNPTHDHLCPLKLLSLKFLMSLLT